MKMPGQRASKNVGPSKLNARGKPPTPALTKRSSKPNVYLKDRKSPQESCKLGGPSKLGKVHGPSSAGK